MLKTDKIPLDEFLDGRLKLKKILEEPESEECVRYFSNGKIQSRFFMKNGILNGPGYVWYENGQLAEEEYYVNGNREGFGRVWIDRGQLLQETNYKRERKHGLERQWYPNGQLRTQGNFVDGFSEGIWMEWDENGNVISKKEFIRGVVIPDKIRELIRSGKLTASHILKIKNTGLRRVCMEMLGYSVFLSQMPHIILDRNGDNELVRVDWYKHEEPLCLVKVKCPSTSAFYTLRVPPDMKTVKQAVAWTFGMNQEKYNPEKET